jgi:hypothetical protein
MSVTATPSPTLNSRAGRASAGERRTLIGLVAFVVIAGIVLVFALAIGSTGIFNVVIFILFAVLWFAALAGLRRRPETVDALWRAFRAWPVLAQALVWLLFLPLTLGLWIWRQPWMLPLRLVLLLGIAAVNLAIFFPRG